VGGDIGRGFDVWFDVVERVSTSRDWVDDEKVRRTGLLNHCGGDGEWYLLLGLPRALFLGPQTSAQHLPSACIS